MDRAPVHDSRGVLHGVDRPSQPINPKPRALRGSNKKGTAMEFLCGVALTLLAETVVLILAKEWLRRKMK